MLTLGGPVGIQCMHATSNFRRREDFASKCTQGANTAMRGQSVLGRISKQMADLNCINSAKSPRFDISAHYNNRSQPKHIPEI
jgi:hypothetical protein